MLHKFLRWVMPLFILTGGYMSYRIIAVHGESGKAPSEELPLLVVQTAPLTAVSHQVELVSYGELVPAESTLLSSQVSGEVTQWHPNFVAGGIVKRGELLFTIESDNYQAAVLEAQANLASAEAALIEERAKAEVAKRQAKKLNNTSVSDLYLRKPQLMSAEARVKSALATLQRRQRDLANCKIVAPFNALVVSRSIGVGQYIAAGAQVAQLYNIELAEVIVPIAGFDTPFLPSEVAGADATIRSEGVLSLSRQGSVARDLGLVDSGTRMVHLVVQLDDPYGLESSLPTLKFGTYVEVSLVGEMIESSYRVPQELVKNHTVWVVDSQQQLQPRRVTTVRQEGEFALISEGFESEDQLLLTVPEFPLPNMRVALSVGIAEVLSDRGRDESR